MTTTTATVEDRVARLLDAAVELADLDLNPEAVARVRDLAAALASLRQSHPPPAGVYTDPDVEHIATAARALIRAVVTAGVHREHFTGRLDALVAPLARLEEALDAAGR